MIFQEIKLGTSVIPRFYVILTEQSISETILIITGQLQGDWKIYLKYYFGDSRSYAKSISTQGHMKVNSKVKNVKI